MNECTIEVLYQSGFASGISQLLLEEGEGLQLFKEPIILLLWTCNTLSRQVCNLVTTSFGDSLQDLITLRVKCYHFNRAQCTSSCFWFWVGNMNLGIKVKSLSQCRRGKEILQRKVKRQQHYHSAWRVLCILFIYRFI